MTDVASSLTRTVARPYDLFQTFLELLQKDPQVLELRVHGLRDGDVEEHQQRLCLEVFQAAEIGKGDVLIDVGFGSGEQDFLLSNAYEFRRLIGFNISERQVRYANERAYGTSLENVVLAYIAFADRASFLTRRAEDLRRGRHPLGEPVDNRVGEAFPHAICALH